MEEQNLADQTVLLKKKYFYSDSLVDRDNPMALLLLYAQSKSAVIQGVHPVTRGEAINLASLEAQIVHGNYSPEKHKPGFLEYAIH